VADLALELKEQDWKRYQLHKHRTYSAVASVIAGVITAHILYKLYMCVFKWALQHLLS